MGLIELSYVSKASYEMDALTLLPILKDSLRWNFDHQITGVLYYENGYFGQIIEGPENFIQETFEKISKDPKHSVKRILEKRKIEDRLFPNWSMQFFGADDILKLVPILHGSLSNYDTESSKIIDAMRKIGTANSNGSNI
jgi:hypothetical protein